ncbi:MULTISPECIES: RHS repeat-associated core domain-containing protein [Pseudomonas]|uniref:RHS repeat-associated core domain-containing protein n=1 Tax=Pseudomonas TaxID=286 RepID=UPI0018A98DF6|nr:MULTISPECIES: RHS repeat-associated core domain-containing protein [Pseudomonas]MBF8767680.1 RHS repeat-associated core domain-containing protein [Pseudomonas putida]MBH3346052.1 RHS repeat-associated core domain-containing protein [Pseudomonas parafulva]MEC4024966.1 RHS repeat-associated core domain-containing protein [Pseudomonas fulva]
MRSTVLPTKKKKFFFQGPKLACEVSDSPRRLLWANGIALAESDAITTSSQLLQSDNSNTALRGIPAGTQQNFSPYGFLHAAPSTHLVTFSGQRLDTMLDCYVLGNGRRLYSSRSRRFLQADTMSPFGKGGPNGYCYCQNDPINRHDPSGKMWEWIKRGVNWLVGQRPTISVDRAQLRIGGERTQSPNLTLILHRAGHTPAPDSYHVSVDIGDVEFVAGVGNRIINSAEVLEPLSSLIINRAENAAIAAAANLLTYQATNTLTLGVAAQLATYSYLERRLIRDTIGEVRVTPIQPDPYDYIRH